MKVYIVRHGQTDANKNHLLQGRSDRALNEAGIQQAQMLAEDLRKAGIVFARVYSGPLQRAVKTAEYISGMTPVIDERLTEMDYGPYEGMDLYSPDPEVMRFFRDFVHEPAPAGMESLQEVTKRLGDFLEDLRKDPVSGNVLLSTHAIALKGALEYLMPEAQGKWWSTNIGNCALFVSELREDGYTVPQEVIFRKGE